jgi:DNA-binding MarR family transcriptional regulator
MPEVNLSIEEAQINYSYLPELIGHLVGLIHLQATQLCMEAMAPLELTPKQFVTLEFISHNPKISQKDIAEHVGTTPTVLVNVLDSLAERSLIQRVRSEEDRRVQFVQLTQAGRAMLDDIRKRAFSVEHQLDEASGLTADEREMLLRLLRKVTGR